MEPVTYRHLSLGSTVYKPSFELHMELDETWILQSEQHLYGNRHGGLGRLVAFR